MEAANLTVGVGGPHKSTMAGSPYWDNARCLLLPKPNGEIIVQFITGENLYTLLDSLPHSILPIINWADNKMIRNKNWVIKFLYVI